MTISPFFCFQSINLLNVSDGGTQATSLYTWMVAPPHVLGRVRARFPRFAGESPPALRLLGELGRLAFVRPDRRRPEFGRREVRRLEGGALGRPLLGEPRPPWLTEVDALELLHLPEKSNFLFSTLTRINGI